MKEKKESNTYVLKIYLKNNKKPLCEIECDNEKELKNLYNEINKTEDLVIFGNRVLFRKSEFDKALLF